MNLLNRDRNRPNHAFTSILLPLVGLPIVSWATWFCSVRKSARVLEPSVLVLEQKLSSEHPIYYQYRNGHTKRFTDANTSTSIIFVNNSFPFSPNTLSNGKIRLIEGLYDRFSRFFIQ